MKEVSFQSVVESLERAAEREKHDAAQWRELARILREKNWPPLNITPAIIGRTAIWYGRLRDRVRPHGEEEPPQ